jgi:hypothetical protein
MRFVMQIECVNAAFEDHPEREVARILSLAVLDIEGGAKEMVLRDVNGNLVGAAAFRPIEEGSRWLDKTTVR